MRFTPSFLDDIKARLPVSEVVRRRVRLAKAGRELVGLSPFGQEKTPSFFVNDAKMAWFDLSAGKNGNIFDFVMQTEGLSFPEAVERLAGEAGLTLPARSPDAERQEQRRAGLHEVLELAAAWFERQLAGERGGKARAYLDGRAIAGESRATFRIGYAPGERHAMRDALAAKGASVEVMCEAGLLIHGDDIAVPYDRFRDRLMFPITDRSGKVIAFGGRALEKDVQAKYLNSPETPLFHKGHVLFNHHRARKAAHDRGRVIAVEGYIDVVAMHAAGFPETVAGLGTALTEEQAGLLWQMAPQPLLCFDGDKAGRKAAFRAAEMALPLISPSRTLAFALLPEGQDPDELIRAAGAPAMGAALDEALPLVELIWRRALHERVLTTPEQRSALGRELEATAAAIRDDGLRREYQREFRQRTYEHFRRMMEERRGPAGRAGQELVGRRDRARRQERYAPEATGYLGKPVTISASLARSLSPAQAVRDYLPREAMIMAIVLTNPILVETQGEDLAAAEFAAPDLATLRDRILDVVHDAPGDASLSAGGLRTILCEAGFGATLARLDAAATPGAWYAQSDAAASDAGEVLHQALVLHHKDRPLQRELVAAEMALASDASEQNVARLVDIKEQLGASPGTEAALEGFGSSSGRVTSSM